MGFKLLRFKTKINQRFWWLSQQAKIYHLFFLILFFTLSYSQRPRFETRWWHMCIAVPGKHFPCWTFWINVTLQPYSQSLCKASKINWQPFLNLRIEKLKPKKNKFCSNYPTFPLDLTPFRTQRYVTTHPTNKQPNSFQFSPPPVLSISTETARALWYQ